MLCRRCNEALQATGLAPWDVARAGAEPGVLCQRCGAVLVTEGLSARVFDKLAQLTRMGLRGRRVLLRPRHGRKER
jgi:hypothetical protein